MAFAGVVIGAIIAVLFLILWYFQESRAKKLINQIPGPPTLPLVGNAHMFKPGGGDFFQQVVTFCEEFQQYGMLRLWVGPEPVVATYRAEWVEVLLSSSKHITKSYLYSFLHPWLGTGLLTSTGSKWKSRRRLLTPSFHFKILNDFLQVFNEQSRIMVEKLKKERAGKGEFDMFPNITLCALDIICDTAMGTNVNAQANKDSEYVKTIYAMTELVNQRQKSPWLWPEYVYNNISAGRKHQDCLKVLHGFTEKVIKERNAEFEEQLKTQQVSTTMETERGEDDLPAAIGKRKRLAFLDMLLYASKEDPEFGFEHIREEVDTFMFEGHDTTAAAANWATHLLGAHPEVQRKAQQEQDAIFGDSDRDATMEDIKNMKYLECVAKEALRLFPSVPMFGRTISEDVNIGNYTVPKGTTALVITYALHRDPKHFPDPDKFDPDRWLPDNAAGRHPFSYVPFSAGPRNCIGQKFAMNEEKVMLSYILRNFNIESCQQRYDLRPVGEIILRPENGIRVKLTERNVAN